MSARAGESTPTSGGCRGAGVLLLRSSRGVHFELADELDVRPHLPVFEGSSSRDDDTLLPALSRLAEICDGVGRWCARHGRTGADWNKAHRALRAELSQLGEQMAAAVGGAAPAAQQHLVLTTLRLAQLAAAARGAETAPAVAALNNAKRQLVVLHGFSGEGPAPVAAAAECDRLGAAMVAAWARFPEAEREALRGLPSEAQGAPEEVGVWSRGCWGQNGRAILRPSLRQSVPPGYCGDDLEANAAGSGGDRYGNRYVAEHLLPAAKRALPRLVGAARRVAEQLGAGSCSMYVPPLKQIARMARLCHDDEEAEDGGRSAHYFHEHPRQASNVDVARVMLVLERPAQVAEALALFRGDSEARVVRVLNRFWKESSAGYRDCCLNLDLGGHYAEVQLSLASLVAVRRRMHKFHGLLQAGGYSALIAKAKHDRDDGGNNGKNAKE